MPNTSDINAAAEIVGFALARECYSRVMRVEFTNAAKQMSRSDMVILNDSRGALL